MYKELIKSSISGKELLKFKEKSVYVSSVTLILRLNIIPTKCNPLRLSKEKGKTVHSKTHKAGFKSIYMYIYLKKIINQHADQVLPT